MDIQSVQTLPQFGEELIVWCEDQMDHKEETRKIPEWKVAVLGFCGRIFHLKMMTAIEDWMKDMDSHLFFQFAREDILALSF